MSTEPTPLANWLAKRMPHLSPEERQRLERDWECYRRELPRLLEEGHGERWVLIKDGQVISIWDTYGDAQQAGHERFGLEPFAVNKVNPLDIRRLPLLDEKLKAAEEAACQP
jgi:hypothetical protein